MIRGHLKSQGYHIPRDRITASFLRVHGAPAIFGDRQISRKKYRVPGPMSLAHMDGQHGTVYSLYFIVSKEPNHCVQRVRRHRLCGPMETDVGRPGFCGPLPTSVGIQFVPPPREDLLTAQANH
ncbi:hypothetical protein B0H11DRAFT_2058064 [Mycena galericulata]|nr:hypothetical protein B0H11DRAFT_2058064 [Mycena galericulata]